MTADAADLTRRAAFALPAALFALDAPAAARSARGDVAAIRAQLDRWRKLYSYGDRPFSFDGYEDLYDNSERLTAFDNFSPDTRTVGWKAYRALWEPLINASFSGQVTRRFVVHSVEVAGDLGWTAIEQWFDAKRKGEPFSSSQYATHIWRKVGGRWRIVHEHINGPVTVNGREIRP